VKRYFIGFASPVTLLLIEQLVREVPHVVWHWDLHDCVQGKPLSQASDCNTTEIVESAFDLQSRLGTRPDSDDSSKIPKLGVQMQHFLIVLGILKPIWGGDHLIEWRGRLSSGDKKRV
jgi:hypothetical protein